MGFASACGSSGNGRFRRKTTVLSSGADSSSVAAISAWPKASADAPAAQAGDDVAAEHLRAVVEQQAVAQRQRPEVLIGVDGMPGQHLLLRVAVGVQCEQRVEHHHAVVAGDEGADQGIEQGQVGVGHELQRGRGRRPDDGGTGDATNQGRGGGMADKLASFHSDRLHVRFHGSARELNCKKRASLGVRP